MVLIRDKIGVNIHTGYPAYKNDIATLKTKLTDMGITWVRDDNPAGASIMGSSFNVVWVGATNDQTFMVNAAKQAVNGGAKAIELFNEPPSNSKESLATDVSINKAVITAVRAISSTIPIWNSAMAGTDKTKATTMGKYTECTHTCIHPYRANRTQSAWDDELAKFYALNPIQGTSLPYNVTETGYNDYFGTNNTTNHTPTTDAVAATQIIPDTLRLWNDGAEKVFYYEMRDQGTYRATDSEQSHFGLCNQDWSYKLHGTALKNYLAAHGGDTFVPGTPSNPVVLPPTKNPNPVNPAYRTSLVSDVFVGVDGKKVPLSQMIAQINGQRYVVWNSPQNKS